MFQEAVGKFVCLYYDNRRKEGMCSARAFINMNLKIAWSKRQDTSLQRRSSFGLRHDDRLCTPVATERQLQ
jgi:hypothetical protein